MLRFGRCSLLILALAQPAVVFAQARPFPVPAGLEDAVEFWKLIFTRHSVDEVVLFDPMDLGTIYGSAERETLNRTQAAAAPRKPPQLKLLLKTHYPRLAALRRIFILSFRHSVRGDSIGITTGEAKPLIRHSGTDKTTFGNII